MAAGPARDWIPLRSEIQDREDLAADGRATRDGQQHPEVRGDRHARGCESQCYRRGSDVPREYRSGPQGRAAALSEEHLDGPAGTVAECESIDESRSGAKLRTGLSFHY